MLTINKLLPQGRGLSSVLLKRAAAVVLDWDTRQKSRFDTEDSQGRHLGVFLARGTVVRGGDVLVAEDGSLVKVIATPQPVLVVRTCPRDGGPADLLQLEPDHVLADMLRQMHLVVTEELAPFEPEAGAYAATHAHGSAHDHEHAHGHIPAGGGAGARTTIPIAVAQPAQGQDHDAAPTKAHVHGPGCGHSH